MNKSLKTAALCGGFFTFIIFLFLSCSSIIPNLIVMFNGEDTLYYFPVSVWETKDLRNASMRVDITHITDEETDVTCNISFITKKRVPQSVSEEIVIHADGTEYKLKDVKLMFTDTKINAYRITSNLKIEELLAICRSNQITIAAKVNDVDCVFYPSKDFIRKKDQFIEIMDKE